jgi:large subunit ribosomal protein LP0
MPAAKPKIVKKEQYDAKLRGYLQEYEKAFLVHADNVGSRQFMDIRAGLRDNGSVVLMGKNTMMKRSIRLYVEETGDEKWSTLVEQLVGNVGLIFTKADLSDVREQIEGFKVGAPARVGLVAPVDVTVPAGNTGLDPSQTNFFQALNIPTKINKGTVEITTDVQLIRIGEKVGASEATLLAKLGIKPFSYGLVIRQVFESGSLYSPSVLDITEEDLLAKAKSAIANITAVSLATSYPTQVAVPHLVINGFKNVLAIALGTEYSFPQADKIKEILENPELLAAATAASAAPAAGDGGGKEEAKEEAKEEEEEEEDDDMGFSLFD